MYVYCAKLKQKVIYTHIFGVELTFFFVLSYMAPITLFELKRVFFALQTIFNCLAWKKKHIFSFIFNLPDEPFRDNALSV